MGEHRMSAELLQRMSADVPSLELCGTLDEICKAYLSEILSGKSITPDELRLIVACSKPGVIALYESGITPSSLV